MTSRFSIKRRILTGYVFALCLVLFCPARLSADTIAEERAAKIESDIKEYGPKLSRQQYPKIYKEIEGMFSRLSRASGEIFPTGNVVVDEIHVLQSVKPEAHVHMLKAAGVPEVRNIVVITTAMLERLFRATGPNGLLTEADTFEGLVALSGVLEHELSHPIDKYDEHGIERSFGGVTGANSIEMRSDTTAPLIAQQAGYPRDGIYRANEIFRDKNAGLAYDLEFRALFAALSLHPDMELRQAGTRQFLAFLAYRRGEENPKYPKAPSAGLIQELRGIKANGSTRPFLAPTTLVEVLDRMRKLAAIPDNELAKTLRNIEFNRLLLTMHQIVQSHGLTKTLPPTEEEAFVAIQTYLATKSGESRTVPHIFSYSEMQDHFTNDTASLGFRGLPTHFQYMEQNRWAYENPKVIALADHIVHDPRPADGRDYWHPYPPWKETTERVMPGSLLFPRYAEQVGEDGWLWGKEEQGSFQSFPHHLRALQGFLAGAEKWTAEKWVKEMPSHSKYLDELGVLFTQNGETQILEEIPDFLASSGYEQRAAKQAHRRLMALAWKNAESLAVLDLVGGSESIDWERIWKTLEIDPAKGRKELRERVLRFAKSSHYADMVKAYSAHPGDFGMKKGPGGQNLFENMRASAKSRTPDWADREVFEALAGRGGDQRLSDGKLSEIARGYFGAPLLEAHPALYKAIYEEILKRRLAERGNEPFQEGEIARIHNSILHEIYGHGLHGKINAPAAVDEPWVHALDESGLPSEHKAQILKAFYFRYSNFDGAMSDEKYGLTDRERYDEPPSDFLKRPRGAASIRAEGATNKSEVTRVLIRYGVIASEADLVRKAGGGELEDHFDRVRIFSNAINRELDAALAPRENAVRRKNLLAFLDDFLDPGKRKPKGHLFGAEVIVQASRPEVVALKTRVLREAAALPLSFQQRAQIFRKLTATGTFDEADAFFRDHLWAGRAGDKPLDPAEAKFFNWVLNNQRLRSHRLRLEVAEMALKPDVEKAACLTGPCRPRESRRLTRITDRLNTWIPSEFLAKDHYLESLAWRVARDEKEVRMLEAYKSFNFRRVNPKATRVASGLSVILAHVSPEERLDLIEYLLNPETVEFPKSIERTVDRAIRQATRLMERHNFQEESETLRAQYQQFKVKLQQLALESQPQERIPLLEFVIASGNNNLVRSAEFPDLLTQRLLGYARDSQDAKLIRVFCEISDPKERGAALAYLIANAKEKGSDPAILYQAFGPLGIRAAQLVARFNLFGPEHSEKIRKLTYEAEPLSLDEVRNIAKKTLSPTELARIKHYVKPLGSASNRAAILVELHDPDGSLGEKRFVVMMVQRPFAKERNTATLNRLRKFLPAVQHAGIELKQGRLLQFMMEDLEYQAQEELKGTKEVKDIATAKAYFEAMNDKAEVKKYLPPGYRFEVPAVVPESLFRAHDHLFFLEYGQGEPYAKASQDVKDQVGPAVAAASLHLRFAYGVGDVDRNPGNVLIDTHNQRLRPIDFGWWIEFDNLEERKAWSGFLMALASSDANALHEAGMKLVEPNLAATADSTRAQAVKENLRTALKKAGTALISGQGSAINDVAFSILDAFESHGLKWQRKFKFGGLMELVTLWGEGYAKDQFLPMVLTEVGASRSGAYDCLEKFQRLAEPRAAGLPFR